MQETPCIQHEEQIQDNTQKIAALQTRADYKDKRIDELNAKMDKIEDKLDKLTDTVNNVVVNSISGDNDLKQRVLALETKLDTQEKLLNEYDEKQRKERDEDRAKTTQYMAVIGTVIGVLSFIFAYIIK